MARYGESVCPPSIPGDWRTGEGGRVTTEGSGVSSLPGYGPDGLDVGVGESRPEVEGGEGDDRESHGGLRAICATAPRVRDGADRNGEDPQPAVGGRALRAPSASAVHAYTALLGAVRVDGVRRAARQAERACGLPGAGRHRGGGEIGLQPARQRRARDLRGAGARERGRGGATDRRARRPSSGVDCRLPGEGDRRW